jgi:hypothetical protein
LPTSSHLFFAVTSLPHCHLPALNFNIVPPFYLEQYEAAIAEAMAVIKREIVGLPASTQPTGK